MPKKQKIYYLIDTENVGDRWQEIAGNLGKKDRMIAFYTENHSRLLGEFLIRHVHDPRFIWLECATGNNALDYQLMGVLSYLIAKSPKAEYHIFSNDQGYQTTVQFWKNRGIDIRQDGFEIPGKKKKGKKKAETAGEDVPDTPVVQVMPDIKADMTEAEYVEEIARAIPLSDGASWYNALTVVLGQEKGREWYTKVRKNEELRADLKEKAEGDLNTRAVHLIAVLLQANKLDPSDARTVYEMSQTHSKKNQKAVYQDLCERFEKKKGQEYYKVLKPALKTIKELK